MYKAQNGFPYPPPGMMPITGSLLPMMTANDQSDAYKAYQYEQANPPVYRQPTNQLGDPRAIEFQKFKDQEAAGIKLNDELTTMESYNNALGGADDSGLDVKFTPAQSYPFSGGLAYDKNAVGDYQAGLMGATTDGGIPPPPNNVNPYNKKAVADYEAGLMGATVEGSSSPTPEDLIDPNTNQPITEEQARERGIDSNAYFGLIKGMDIASLIRNSMQAPPPNVQLAQTHLQRVDLDTTPFDVERAKIGEMQNKSFRRFREGAGQIGDLMRGVAAVSGQGIEALRNVGVAERQQLNQESMMNVDIQNKEQMIQDQQHDKELMTNYQIQAEGQAVKNKMITDNLTNIKKDFQVEAQYNEQKEAMLRQEEYDKNYINKQQEVQLLTLAHQQAIGYDETTEYAEGLRSKRVEFLNTMEEDLKTEYGARPDFNLIDDERLAVGEQSKKIKASETYIKAHTPIDPGLGADQNLIDQYQKDLTQNTKDQVYLKTLQDQQLEAEKELTRKESYRSEFNRRFRESKIEGSYRSEYMESKGLMSPQQIQKRIETLLTTEK